MFAHVSPIDHQHMHDRGARGTSVSAGNQCGTTLGSRGGDRMGDRFLRGDTARVGRSPEGRARVDRLAVRYQSTLTLQVSWTAFLLVKGQVKT